MTHIYDDIRETPCVIEVKEFTRNDRIHESLLKSYGILRQVKIMLDRGDSKETVREMIDFLEIKPDKRCDFNL